MQHHHHHYGNTHVIDHAHNIWYSATDTIEQHIDFHHHDHFDGPACYDDHDILLLDGPAADFNDVTYSTVTLDDGVSRNSGLRRRLRTDRPGAGWWRRLRRQSL
jgi:hypothetical protein